MSQRNLEAVVEAILFACEEALSAERVSAALERQDATPEAVRLAVETLNRQYRETERTFEIVEVAGGFKLLTLPEFNGYVRRVLRGRSRDKLSQAALETLAVVAYRQPVTRADIENIRGVEAGPVLRMLVDRGMVRIVGRDESLGHPLLYGTTKLFLEMFGLRDLAALPKVEELTKVQRDGPEPGEDGEPGDGFSSPAIAGQAEAVAGAEAAAAGDTGEAGDRDDASEPLPTPAELAAQSQALAEAMAAMSDEPAAEDEESTDDGDEPAAEGDDEQSIIQLADHVAESSPAQSDDPAPATPDDAAEDDDSQE